MKVSILVALVAVVATSVATAQPREERGGRVPFTEPSRPRIPAPPPRVGDWIALATPTPTRFETEWIVVGRAAGAFRTVRIQATAGIVHLRSIRIELPTGKVMMFATDHWLDARHPNADIDLGAPRYIGHIAVTTARMPAGAYTVFGATGIAPVEQLIAARWATRAAQGSATAQRSGTAGTTRQPAIARSPAPVLEPDLVRSAPGSASRCSRKRSASTQTVRATTCPS